jgi:hypothetical protein
MQSIVFLFVVALLTGCAGQRPPEGGPIDTEPPFVASTLPPNYTTRFAGNSITLEFSEYVDHRSVEGAIFISPSLGQLEFDWSGREVEIRFPGQLRRYTTYVVTVGTDVADIRNRNKMAQSFTLAFSTGEDIDHGAVEGRIFPRTDIDPPVGVMVFAYKLDGLNPDTLDPRTTKPDFVTQTGTNGDFLLSHLAFGSYRVIAVRDEYKNLLYDPEVDEFGVQPEEIALTPADTLKSGVWMKLEREDTSAVRLLKVSPTNQRHLVVEFSLPIDTTGISATWFRILDTLDQTQLAVKSVCPVFPTLNSVLVVTDTQTAGATYRLEVAVLRGINGLVVSPVASQLTFSSTEARDTLGPKIVSFSLSDSAREIDVQPRFLLHFSDAVQTAEAGKAIALLDSSRNLVPVSLRWLSDASLEIFPAGRLISRAWFAFRIGMRSVMNLDGKRGKDSLRVFRFQTVDEESFSSIEGSVSDTSNMDAKGDVFLTARNVSRKEPKEYTVRIRQPGVFVLGDILEGKYVIRAYRDRSGNRNYDPGLVFPFQRSERFVAYPDTLKVRARWPLEGVVLKFQ